MIIMQITRIVSFSNNNSLNFIQMLVMLQVLAILTSAVWAYHSGLYLIPPCDKWCGILVTRLTIYMRSINYKCMHRQLHKFLGSLEIMRLCTFLPPSADSTCLNKQHLQVLSFNQCNLNCSSQGPWTNKTSNQPMLQSLFSAWLRIILSMLSAEKILRKCSNRPTSHCCITIEFCITHLNVHGGYGFCAQYWV